MASRKRRLSPPRPTSAPSHDSVASLESAYSFDYDDDEAAFEVDGPVFQHKRDSEPTCVEESALFKRQQDKLVRVMTTLNVPVGEVPVRLLQ